MPSTILPDITIEGIAAAIFPVVIALFTANTAVVSDAIPIVIEGPTTSINGISSPN